MGDNFENENEDGVVRRSSLARWSVSHPVKVDKPPSKYQKKRFYHRFIPGKTPEISTDEHLVFLNDHEKNAHFPKNVFTTSKYTALNFIFKNMYEQFRRVANTYFLVITIMQFIPGVSPFPVYITVGPLTFILGVTAVKEGYEDSLRHKSDNKVNSAKVTLLDPHKKEPVTVKSSNIRVGDIIALDRDHVCSADIVVLATEHNGKNEGNPICWVDTANLDGETRLKVRRAANLQGFIPGLEEDSQPEPSSLLSVRGVITSDPPNPYIEVFSGRIDSTDPDNQHVIQLVRENLILRGAVLRNTKRVWGVVVGAGPITKLRLNQQLPAYKFSHLERALNVCLAVVFSFQVILCILLATIQIYNTETMSVLNLNPTLESWSTYNWNGAGNEKDSTIVAWIYSFMTWFILLSFLIPMSLYVIMELGKMMGGLYIHWDANMYSRDKLRRPAKPNTTSLVEELGEVQYVLSDKTGTLTDNEMRFTHCGTASGMYEMDFQETKPVLRKMASGNKRGSKTNPVNPSDKALRKLFMIMALCNELEVEKEVVDGERVIEYSGESPDEVSLGSTARDFGLVLDERSPSKIKLLVDGEGEKQYKLLAILPFTSSRKRMGVVVQESGSNKAMILYKGADNIMFGLFNETHNLNKLNEQVETMSRLGLRTLVLAQASIDVNSSKFEQFKQNYDEALVAMEDRDTQIGEAFETLETLLEPVGCTGVEDKLSDGVEEALQNLVKANIQVAVLTGDKTETAISICMSCGLFKPGSQYHKLTDANESVLENYLKTHAFKGIANDPEEKENVKGTQEHRVVAQVDVDDVEAQVIRDSLTNDEALIVSGECLKACIESEKLRPMFVKMMKRCYTTVCTRMTPKQKAVVTKLVREEFGVICLSIGDGANDVSMIREADVGVGVFGKEGSQAVNSADFAIHKFADLQRLLFIHGATSRLRISTAARASLFANFAFTVPQIFFGIVSVYSGVSILLGNILTFVNLLMTSPFLLSIAFVDREMLPDQLVKNPQLYEPYKPAFSLKDYFIEIGLALWHGLVASFIAYFSGSVWVEDGVVAGMWAGGTLLTMILLTGILISLALRNHVFTIIQTIAVFLGFLAFLFAALILPHIWGPNSTDNGYILSYIGYSAYFWLLLIVGVLISLLPSWVVKAYMGLWHPSRQQIFLEAKKTMTSDL